MLKCTNKKISKHFLKHTKHIQWHHPSFCTSLFPLSIFSAFGHENLRGVQWVQSLFSSIRSSDCVNFSCLINAAFLRQVGDEIFISGRTFFSFIFRFLLGNSLLEQLVSLAALPWNLLLGAEPIIHCRLKAQINNASRDRPADLFLSMLFTKTHCQTNKLQNIMHVSRLSGVTLAALSAVSWQ